MSSLPVKVRFPPSPTGYCHVGTARMALVNYLFARKTEGSIVFRSEDTDRERSKKEYEDDITDQLHWLGLSWDEFYRQSQRLPHHVAAIERLLANDKAYVSKEESKREPGVLVEVVRLRNPGRSITFNDVIRGDITFETAELGDFTIARAIDDPLYHLAVVVDDAEMSITHVIRGEEHISNTPRQILIQEALGYPRPIYAHYPLFLSADRAKLSKRKGDVAVRTYRSQGYVPEALINFIGTLGWSPPSGKELLTLKEMVGEFELADLHKSGAVFDMEKLRWFNRQYVERMSSDLFAEYAQLPLSSALDERGLPHTDAQLRAVLPIVHERVSVSSEIAPMVQEGEFDCFFSEPELDVLRIPERRSDPQDADKHLSSMAALLQSVPESAWDAEAIKAALWDHATQQGRGAVLWPLRYCLSGKEKSPDPFIIAGIIGKERTLARIAKGVSLLRL